jgi:hypothetical protein
MILPEVSMLRFQSLLSIVVVLCSVLPHRVSAQVQDISAGEKVRVHFVPASLFLRTLPGAEGTAGTVTGLDGVTMMVNYAGRTAELPIDQIEGMQVQRGRKWRTGAITGFVIGGLLGASAACFDLFNEDCATSDGTLGFLGGGLLVALTVGAPIGALFHKWEDVSMESLVASPLGAGVLRPTAAGDDFVTWVPVIGGAALLATGVGSLIYDSSLSDDAGPYIISGLGLVVMGAGLRMRSNARRSARGSAVGAPDSPGNDGIFAAPLIGFGEAGLRLGVTIRY